VGFYDVTSTVPLHNVLCGEFPGRTVGTPVDAKNPRKDFLNVEGVMQRSLPLDRRRFAGMLGPSFLCALPSLRRAATSDLDEKIISSIENCPQIPVFGSMTSVNELYELITTIRDSQESTVHVYGQYLKVRGYRNNGFVYLYRVEAAGKYFTGFSVDKEFLDTENNPLLVLLNDDCLSL
jgi:hypothetical protein